MTLIAINPATGQKLAEYQSMTIPEMVEAIEASDAAFQDWRFNSFEERSKCFRALAEKIRVEKEDLGLLMTREMGKPIAQAKAEVEKCAWVCDFYAENAEKFLEDVVIETDAPESFVTFEPLGVILAIMPWNFPFWQVFRAAVPAMMAGNVMVMKHSANVPGCALALERLFAESGFPTNLFRTLLVGSKEAPVAIAHDLVKAVTLTGSTAAGEKVAALAGSQIKKCVLELGGSDAYVVLEDADLERAAKALAAGRYLNTGQSCIAVKRIIVVESVLKEFEALFVKELESYQMGDTEDEDTKLGAMAREDLRDELHEQVRKSIEGGARLLLGGEVPNKPGAWYPATVLTDVKPGMVAADEELFGPVASILPAKDEADAIRLANATPYGLGGGVFTQDLERGKRLACKWIQSGSVAVNDFVKSDPRMPFGGIGKSGYGRELASFGIREFVNIKSIVVN